MVVKRRIYIVRSDERRTLSHTTWSSTDRRNPHTTRQKQRRKLEVLVFIFPLLFALVPGITLVASPDVSRKMKFRV